MVLRILSQAGDGTLQVGMASYILFSPQTQPNAWAIAGVLAITLLPFTVIGPFVSPLLDRWSRRDVALWSDVVRTALTIVLGLIIWFGLTSGAWAIVLFGALLIAMSVNRFMLAGLSAGLQHTVDEDEYLTASSLVPTVGPLGVIVGAAAGLVTRFAFDGVLTPNQTDGLVFGLAAILFLGSVWACYGFAPDALGPDEPSTGSTKVRDVATGLAQAGRHLRTRPVAILGLLQMAITRLLFGLLSVAVILAARHLWHPVDEPELAMADLAVWGLAAGAGFVVAALLAPTLVRLSSLRATSVAMLLLGAATSFIMATTSSKPVIFVTSFFVGLAVQSFKICVDTIVQAHVDERYKGRAFTFYDMLFNGAFVLAGVVAALTLPETGLSMAAFLVMGVAYLACAAWFVAAAARLGHATFEKGTGDLTRTS